MTEPEWTAWTDDKLMDLRICDLNVSIEGIQEHAEFLEGGDGHLRRPNAQGRTGRGVGHPRLVGRPQRQSRRTN